MNSGGFGIVSTPKEDKTAGSKGTKKPAAPKPKK